MNESKELGMVAGKYFAAAVGFGIGVIVVEWTMKFLSPKPIAPVVPAPVAATDTKKKAS